jgi:hypothetical protein
MNMDVGPENEIPEPVMRSMFQLTNIELANAKHCTNITNPRQYKKVQ